MENKTIISLNDLLKNKKKLQEERAKPIVLDIEELGGLVKFRKISMAEFADIVSNDNEDKDAELIFNTMIEPNLKASTIPNDLGYSYEPSQCVNELMSFMTKQLISQKIIELSGFSSEKAVTEITETAKGL